MGFFQRRPPFFLMVATGATCTVVLLVFARLCYGLVLPAMRQGLGLSYAQAADLGTATALGYLLLVMVAGVFAARFGGKLSILLGIVMVTGGFIGLSQAHDFVVLMLLMVLLGMGTAFGYTPLISLLSNSFPERRGAVIGFTNSGVGAGMLLAGALVPMLTAGPGHDGWRHVWQVFAAGGLLVGMLALLVLRNPPGSEAHSLEETIEGPEHEPIFKNPHVITVGLVYGVLGLTYIVEVTFMYSYALHAGMSPRTAGHLVSTMGVLSVFSGPLWGWLCDRLGHTAGLVLSMGLSLVGTLIPVLWPVPTAFAVHFVVLGLCISGLFTSVLTASTATVPPQRAAVAVSFVTLFYAIGQFLGPATAGALIQWSGFRLAFAASCVTMAVGVCLCWRTRRYRHYRPVGSALRTCPAGRTP